MPLFVLVGLLFSELNLRLLGVQFLDYLSSSNDAENTKQRAQIANSSVLFICRPTFTPQAHVFSVFLLSPVDLRLCFHSLHTPVNVILALFLCEMRQVCS